MSPEDQPPHAPPADESPVSSEGRVEVASPDRKRPVRWSWVLTGLSLAAGGGLYLLGGGPASAGFFLIGVVLLLLGGQWLVDGSVTIAMRLRVPVLIIGLTVVAFGTSAPELAFNVIAATHDNPSLSFGNIVGSNIANLGLVLGLAALIAPITVNSRVVWREIPQLIIISSLFFALAYLPPRLQVDGVAVSGWSRTHGGILLLLFALVTWLWYRAAVTQRRDAIAKELEEAATEEATVIRSLPLAAFAVLIGLVGLLAGGQFAERGAVGLAQWAGMSEAMIGLTVVALATSLPEAATSVIAAFRNEADLAVGNVVGSNLFNILLIMGVTSVIAPVPLPSFAWAGAWVDLSVMLGLTVLLWPLARSTSYQVRRFDGLILLACFAAYIGFCIWREIA